MCLTTFFIILSALVLFFVHEFGYASPADFPLRFSKGCVLFQVSFSLLVPLAILFGHAHVRYLVFHPLCECPANTSS